MKINSFYLILLLTFLVSSCYKLEENSKRFSPRKLNKMLEGNWELIDYQIDGVSYLDTLLKIKSPHNWNCNYFTITKWKGNKGTEGNFTDGKGDFIGNCEDYSVYSSSSSKYSFETNQKLLHLAGPYFVDPIHFNTYKENNNIFDVLKLNEKELVLSSEKTGKKRRLVFSKK